MIFTVNGQTHGHLTKEFFNRKNAGRLNYIADSILVTVDCSAISTRGREDLFKNSRDRLSGEDIRYALEVQLEEMLKQHQGLRALKEKRRAEEIQSKLEDEKPLEDILKSLLDRSPTLSELFLQGRRATNPFKTIAVRENEAEFKGRKHPTYFKFKDKSYGDLVKRDCHLNHRCRIVFETDAANDCFSRKLDKGEFSLYLVVADTRVSASDYVGPNLQNGIAILTVQLPAKAHVDDDLTFEAIVTDPTMIEPFVNRFVLNVKPEMAPPPPGHGERRKPPSQEMGEKRETPAGISLPKIVLVSESDWNRHNPPFDKFTALRVGVSDVPEGNGSAEDAKSHDVYDFKINMDNLFLRSELKTAGDEVKLVQARWQYSLVLVGLALLHDDAQKKKTKAETADHREEEEDEENIEAKIGIFTKALAPVLLPMIDSLGTLELENVAMTAGSGEAT